jgi:hypothetical protein
VFNPNDQNLGQATNTGTTGQNSIGNTTFDPAKHVDAIINGLSGFISKPPSTYDEAGGYDQYISKWREFYENLRKMFGLGDTWSQDDIDKFRPIFEKLGIKFQAKPGEKWSSRIYIPDGKGGFIQIDTRGGQGQSGWVNYGHTEQSGAFGGGGGGRAPSGPPAGGGGGGAGTGLPGGGGGAGLTGPWADRANDLFKTLQDRANQSLQINRMDPIIRNQSDAFAAMQTRAMRDALNAEAERAGPFANMRAERRSAGEKVGQATSAFEAQLMGTELTARRAEIAQALQMQGSLLTTEQQLELTRELGLIDAALRQLSISNQNNQFFANLGFQAEDRASVFDLIRRGLINGGV